MIVLILIVSIFLNSFSLQAEDHFLEKSDNKVRVGLWNALFIDDEEFISNRTKDVSLIQKYLSSSNSDILVLLAVSWDSVNSEGQLRNKTIDKLIKKWNQSKNVWQYLILPSQDKFQFSTVILWNNKVKISDNPYRLPVNRYKHPKTSRMIWDREPWAIKFQTCEGYSDFVIIPVYQKAGFGKEHYNHRSEEAKELIKMMPSVKENFNDDDIIILGRMYQDPKEDTGKIFKHVGFKDLNKNNEKSIFWLNKNYEFKLGFAHCRIFCPLFQPEFINSNFVMLDKNYIKSLNITPGMFYNYISNYFMMFTDISVIEDDD